MLLVKTYLFVTHRKIWENNNKYQHNKLKIIAPILNDELDAGFYFASDIQD